MFPQFTADLVTFTEEILNGKLLLFVFEILYYLHWQFSERIVFLCIFLRLFYFVFFLILQLILHMISLGVFGTKHLHLSALQQLLVIAIIHLTLNSSFSNTDFLCVTFSFPSLFCFFLCYIPLSNLLCSMNLLILKTVLMLAESAQSLFYQCKPVWNPEGILTFLILLTGILLYHIDRFFLFQFFSFLL